jgi:hypothetical protein
MSPETQQLGSAFTEDRDNEGEVNIGVAGTWSSGAAAAHGLTEIAAIAPRTTSKATEIAAIAPKKRSKRRGA